MSSLQRDDVAVFLDPRIVRADDCEYSICVLKYAKILIFVPGYVKMEKKREGRLVDQISVKKRVHRLIQLFLKIASQLLNKKLNRDTMK